MGFAGVFTRMSVNVARLTGSPVVARATVPEMTALAEGAWAYRVDDNKRLKRHTATVRGFKGFISSDAIRFKQFTISSMTQ
jgi:hypothetical protein